MEAWLDTPKPVHMPIPTMKQAKELYDRGMNIMRLFRESEAGEVNSINGILAAYDLQSGSYVELLGDPAHAVFIHAYSRAIAAILDRYSPASVMEAGVGEATTLVNVLRQMQHPPANALGFDISWSRIAVAHEFAEANDAKPRLFVGALEDIPIEADSVDVVYTSHSIEPNRGREAKILRELFRVTRRYLVLLEPSNELGSAATQRRIEEHKYCLDLYAHTQNLGFNVIEHRLFDQIRNPENETAVMVIAKQNDSAKYVGEFLACPHCCRSLIRHKGNYFCTECLVVYPEIDGIPCLLKSHAVIATRYLDVGTFCR
jgi:ubiquinone/menaquinone biosynthesis C-methylase UbiE/uncharacterized protein YbaR (Trm112 family)